MTQNDTVSNAIERAPRQGAVEASQGLAHLSARYGHLFQGSRMMARPHPANVDQLQAVLAIAEDHDCNLWSITDNWQNVGFKTT